MKIGLISLGCPKNLVDSEVMLGLAQRGRPRADERRRRPPTCSSSTPAPSSIRRSRNRSTPFSRWRSSRRTAPAAGWSSPAAWPSGIATSCKAEIPEIDAVLGTGEVPEIVARHRRRDVRGDAADVLSRRRTPRSASHAEPPAPCTPAPSTAARPTYIYDADTPRLLATPRHYAYVKIAEGCDYKCAFCIIPTLRGAYRSRPADSIVREARALAARGVKELLLISQDTTFYGIDRQERGALARLLRELNAIDGLEWIRLLYLYPTTIDDETLAAMAECEKVCKYIDLPLQHASNPVLERDEAARHAPEVRRAARPHPRPRARRRAPHHVHRRLPGRDRRGRRRAVRRSSPTTLRPRRRLHLLARGRHLGLRARRRRAGADEDGAARPGHGPAEAARGARGSGPGSASGPGCWWTARPASTSWC